MKLKDMKTDYPGLLADLKRYRMVDRWLTAVMQGQTQYSSPNVTIYLEKTPDNLRFDGVDREGYEQIIQKIAALPIRKRLLHRWMYRNICPYENQYLTVFFFP